MKQVDYREISNIINDKLSHGGVFFTTGDMEKANTMTMGWGGALSFWGKGVFAAPVRPSRFSYGLLKERGEFTISIPLHDMKKELAFAGSRSGRDVDKFIGHGLTKAPAAQGITPIIAECELHLVCRVVGETDLTADHLSQDIVGPWYAKGDFHTLFFGQILTAYYTNE